MRVGARTMKVSTGSRIGSRLGFASQVQPNDIETSTFGIGPAPIGPGQLVRPRT